MEAQTELGGQRQDLLQIGYITWTADSMCHVTHLHYWGQRVESGVEIDHYSLQSFLALVLVLKKLKFVQQNP